MTPPPERRLEDLFAHLEPGDEPQDRMERRVVAHWERERQSLTAEWLSMLHAGPVLTPIRTAAAAACVLLLTPLGTVIFAMLLLR